MRSYFILWWQVKIIGGVPFTLANGIINHAVDCRLSTLCQKRGNKGKLAIRSINQTTSRGCAIHRIGSSSRSTAIAPLVTIIAFRC